MTCKTSILIAFLNMHRRRMAACFSFDFVANLFTLALPLLASQAFALLFGHGSARGSVLVGAGIPLPQDFPSLIGVFGAVLATKAALDFFRKRLSRRISEDFVYWLRGEIFSKQLQLDLKEYEEKGVGRYLLRYSGDLSSVQNYVSRGILQFAADISLVAIGTALIFWLEAGLGWLVIGWLVVLAAVISLIHWQAGKVELMRRNRKSGLLAFVNCRLLNIVSLRALNRLGMEAALFERRVRRLRQLGYRYAGLTAAQDAMLPLAVYGLIGAMLLFAWHGNHELGTESLFAVLMILLTWRPVLQRLLRTGMVWKKGSISLHSIARLFRRSFKPSHETSTTAEKSPKYLVFKGLRFEGWTLDLSLKPGETGFATLPNENTLYALLRYLSGLERPATGQFFLGKTDVSKADLRSYRRKIAFASTAFPLYGNTLGEALTNSSRRQSRKKAAMEYAIWKHLFPELKNLDFNTRLAETAAHLPPEQHSLLLLFRGLQTNKPFLVLDGIFKHLSTETTATVVSILQAERQNRALLFLGVGMSEAVLPGLLFDQKVQAKPAQVFQGYK